MDLLQKLLNPPPIKSDEGGAFHAERILAEWSEYLKSLGITEAHYLKLLEDLRELQANPPVLDRVMHRLIPEWENEFKELNSLRLLAFAKVEAPKPLTLASLQTASVTSTNPSSPPPASIGPSRESVAHYLDSVYLWSGEFDKAAQGAMHGVYPKLAQETKAISAEIGTALKKGKPIDVARLRQRLSPLVLDLAKQVDGELPKLARLHHEGLMIQHGIGEHVKALRGLIADRRRSVLAESESLPEWQQDSVLRQLEREEMRLQTLEKIKLGFDVTVARSTESEKGVEHLRSQLTELSIFLNGHVGATPLSREQAEALRKLLDGYAR